ncbi:unnamed protein product [Rotaria sp. Silwood1]|nr:unnamed protein product [Rotaria sp. Silwood1]CAF1365684.1 unnamed protein product [Rotaria sp. Silwood1]CAF3604222.1 unnamed protein product [Rotaria sp. Silwood1]CAF4632949.1 unnamed protein product [Rotaria sp. Silwood1]
MDDSLMDTDRTQTGELVSSGLNNSSNNFLASVRIHPVSDIFDPKKSYVGLISYSTGDIYIKQSDWILKNIPHRKGRRGQYIHGRLFYSIFGYWKPRNTTFIGCGFSYFNGAWNFKSGTLNETDQELDEFKRKRLQLILDTLYVNHRWLEMPMEIRINNENLATMMEENKNYVSRADPSKIDSKRKLHGCLKWLNDEKRRLGFIECVGLDRDLYVHASNILNCSSPVFCTSKNVEFNIVEGSHGWKAENITVIWP